MSHERLSDKILNNHYLNISYLIFVASFFVFSIFLIFSPQKQYIKDFFSKIGFKLEKIYVSELEYVKLDEVMQVVGLETGDSVFAGNLKQIQKNIKEVSPWVSQVGVIRELPNILHLVVKEHVPKAMIEDDNMIFFVDAAGKKILEIEPKQIHDFENIMMLYGENAVLYLSNLLEFIEEDSEIFSYIEYGEWVGDRRWDIKLVNGVKIMLPEIDPERAWRRFLKINKKINLFDYRIKSVDFRLDDRIFFKMKNRKILEHIS
jgi:cell division protein FtsQ